jgi:hopanoid-associated phosphorylase
MASLIFVVGMLREARIAGLGGAIVVVGGGRRDILEDRLASLGPGAAAGVLSFGLCGALDPSLKPGDLLIASAITHAGRNYPADVDWVDRLAARLPRASRALFAGADAFVVDAADKAALADLSGAVAVDTESHIAAIFAERHGLAFASLRAVSDGAARALPSAAQVGLRADGRADLGAVLANLVAHPVQLPALIGTALEAEAGFRALRRCAGLLRDVGWERPCRGEM